MSAFSDMMTIDAAEASDGAHPAIQLEAAIQHGKVRKSDFFASLISQYHAKGYLSDKQIACIEKAILKPATPTPTGPKAVAIDVSQILDLFATAKASGLKYPKIRMTADGHKLVLNVAGDKAKEPGTVNVTDGGPFGDNVWYGRITTSGEFQQSRSSTPAVVAVLTKLAADPHATAHAYGLQTNNCCFCSKTLTDKRSVSAGYGPTCADNFGLSDQWASAADNFETGE